MSPLVRAWDLLVWLTVLLPIFTGGVQFRSEGMRFELAQINAQVFLLAVFAAVLAYGRKERLENASSVRLLLRVWHLWEENLRLRPRRTLLMAVFVQTIFWSGTAIARHWGLQSAAADMGIFLNGIWNFVNGNGMISAGKSGAHLFTDHQSPIFYLVGPIFWLLPKVETALVVQSLGILSAGTALYWLARQYEKIPHALAALCPWLLWLYHPLRSANRFDFHPETLMLPFFLWAVVWLQGPQGWRRVLGFLFFGIGLSGKESAGPVGVGISLAWLLGAAPESSRRFTRLIALPMAALSVGVFLVDTLYVPKLFGRNYAYQNAYAHFGPSTLHIVIAPFTQPVFFFSYLLQKERIAFFIASLAPLCFLPLLGWRGFVAAIPNYLVLLLSVGTQRISLGYHYSIELSTGIFWGTILALNTLSAHPREIFGKKISTKVLLVALGIASLGTYGRSDLYFWRHYPLNAHEQWVRDEFFPALSQAPIIAPRPYVPHLSLRPWAHFLPILEITEGSGRYVDCVVFDDAIPLLPGEREASLAKLTSLGYSERFRCGSLYLWQKPDGEACLAREPVCKN